MRYATSFTLRLPGDVVLREPTSWERVKRLFLPAHRAPDLSTQERDLNRNVVSLTEGICAALREVEVTDAVYLAVDGRAVYFDAAGVPNDAEKLLEAAIADSQSSADKGLWSDAQDAPFRELRTLFMQRAEGLDLLYEVTFYRRFPKDAPAAFIALSGRLYALRPQSGEALSESEARLRTVLRDGDLLGSLRAYFDELAERLRAALCRAFPESSVARSGTTAFITRPSPPTARELARRGLADPRPTLRARPVCYHEAHFGRSYYDPFDCYYEDPGLTWAALVALRDLIEHRWIPKLSDIDVVDSAGKLLCHAASAAAHTELFGGVCELAAQDFLHLELHTVKAHIEQCIDELPDPAMQFSEISAPELPALSSSDLASDVASDGMASAAIGSLTEFGGDVSSTVSDAASSVVDAISSFDPFD